MFSFKIEPISERALYSGADRSATDQLCSQEQTSQKEDEVNRRLNNNKKKTK